MKRTLQIAERVVGDVTILDMQGRLVLDETEFFRRRVDELLRKNRLKVVLNLKDVTYIDSASIGSLMDIHRLMADREGRVRVTGLQPRVETMISMTGLHKIIDLHRDEAEAIRAFGGGEDA